MPFSTLALLSGEKKVAKILLVTNLPGVTEK